MCVSSCGGGSSSDANEPTGTYQVKVVTAKFPTAQRLAQTSLLRIGVRNTGTKTVPALVLTASIAGKAGQTSSLPFGIHDPQPGLSQPDRPVWVLAQNYPRLVGATQRAGAQTASPKSFAFGPLKPGATTEAIWKLTASKSGNYTLLYTVDASLRGTAKAETAAGTQPGGSFAVKISSAPPNTIVKGNGKVVVIPDQKGGQR